MNKLGHAFILASGTVIFFLSVNHLFELWSSAQYLSLADPLFGISTRTTLQCVAPVELAIALQCLFGKKLLMQITLIAWLTTNYFLYQIGLIYHECHGFLEYLFPSHFIFRVSLLSITFGTVLIICYCLFYLASHAGQRTTKFSSTQPVGLEFLKITCLHCHGHIEFPQYALGREIACPHCSQNLVLSSGQTHLNLVN